MTRRASVLLALFGLSCASSVELSSAPELTGSADPNVIGQINEQVAQIAVEGDRLYWVGSRPDPKGINVGTYALRSCLKDACATSLISYATDGVVASMNFDVQGGQVYWFRQDDLMPPPAMGSLYGWSLLTCPVSGCGLAAPRRIASGAELFYAMNTAFTDGTVYVWGEQLFSVFLAQTDGSAQVLDSTSSFGSTLVVAGDYLYELNSGVAGLASPGGATLTRFRRDGSEPQQTLASNLPLPPPDGDYANRRLAVDSKYVYWLQGTLYGSIARCAISGCDGKPEVVLEPIASPTALLLDGDNLYWQHYDARQGYSISSCSAASCSPASIADGADASNALAFDEQYLYAAVADQLLTPEEHPTDPWARIRRFPKPMENKP